MADFCLQCNLDLFFGPYSDLDGLSTPDDTANGLYPVVLCEGCGPIQVDHIGRCVSVDCEGRHGDPAVSPGLGKAYERAARWVARRSGPLGPLLRLRDRFLGTPWEPGLIHFGDTRVGFLYNLYRAIREGMPLYVWYEGEPFSLLHLHTEFQYPVIETHL